MSFLLLKVNVGFIVLCLESLLYHVFFSVNLSPGVSPLYNRTPLLEAPIQISVLGLASKLVADIDVDIFNFKLDEI